MDDDEHESKKNSSLTFFSIEQQHKNNTRKTYLSKGLFGNTALGAAEKEELLLL